MVRLLLLFVTLQVTQTIGILLQSARQILKPNLKLSYQALVKVEHSLATTQNPLILSNM